MVRYRLSTDPTDWHTSILLSYMAETRQTEIRFTALQILDITNVQTETEESTGGPPEGSQADFMLY